MGHALGTLNAGRIGCIGCKFECFKNPWKLKLMPFLQTTCFRFWFDSDAPIVWEAKRFDCFPFIDIYPGKVHPFQIDMSPKKGIISKGKACLCQRVQTPR